VRKLYLIRHAKSNKDIAGLKDEERPLNKRGKIEARYVGSRLRKYGIIVQAIYTSPAKRASDTAKAIAKELGLSRNKIKVDNLIYDSNIVKLMRVIKKIDNKVESAVIIGHNPEFLNLVNYLTPRTIKEFPTCGVFVIYFSIDSWKKLARGKGKLVFSESPRKGL